MSFCKQSNLPSWHKNGCIASAQVRSSITNSDNGRVDFWLFSPWSNIQSTSMKQNPINFHECQSKIAIECLHSSDRSTHPWSHTLCLQTPTESYNPTTCEHMEQISHTQVTVQQAWWIALPPTGVLTFSFKTALNTFKQGAYRNQRQVNWLVSPVSIKYRTVKAVLKKVSPIQLTISWSKSAA